MFLEKLLKESDNSFLHHFDFERNGHKFTFFSDANKNTLSCFKSVPEALLEYFQSRQFFPPYLSWELGDMISEHQDEQGYAFISDELLDFEIDTNQDMLIQIFEKINYRVVSTGNDKYHIFDENNTPVYGILNFYQCLAVLFHRLNAIDDEMLESVLSQ